MMVIFDVKQDQSSLELARIALVAVLPVVGVCSGLCLWGRLKGNFQYPKQKIYSEKDKLSSL